MRSADILQLAAAGGGGNAALGFVYIIIGIVLYWVPALVAWRRHVPNVGSVAVVDGLLGWTIIGWIVALAMACRDPRRDESPPDAPEWAQRKLRE